MLINADLTIRRRNVRSDGCIIALLALSNQIIPLTLYAMIVTVWYMHES